MTLLPISRRSLLMLLITGLAALLLAGAACGGGDDDDSGETATATAEATTPAEDGGDGEQVSFDVSTGDNFFEPKDFTVPAGATVTFHITNDGVAIHNMRVAGEDNKYNTDDDAVSDPDLIPGGATATLEWTAPDSSGEIKFQCDFHPTDSLGTITVE